MGLYLMCNGARAQYIVLAANNDIIMIRATKERFVVKFNEAEIRLNLRHVNVSNEVRSVTG